VPPVRIVVDTGINKEVGVVVLVLRFIRLLKKPTLSFVMLLMPLPLMLVGLPLRLVGCVALMRRMPAMILQAGTSLPHFDFTEVHYCT